MASAKGNQSDSQLVRSCLKGEDEAWRQLKAQYEKRLLGSIQARLAPKGRNPELAEEIADRVWDSLLWNDSYLLRMFDASKGSLAAYLTTLAHYEIGHYARRAQEEKEWSREWARHHAPVVAGEESEWPVVLADFMATLSKTEKRLVLTSLGKIPDTGEFRGKKKWNTLRRIERKWEAFFRKE
jgi:DNA-directed RNA polymerase specialized sigma24 family protein